MATTRSAAKHDLLKQAGADNIIVTSEHDLTQAVLATTAEKASTWPWTTSVVGPSPPACPLPRSTARSSTSASSTRRRTIDLDALSYHHLRVHAACPSGSPAPRNLAPSSQPPATICCPPSPMDAYAPHRQHHVLGHRRRGCHEAPFPPDTRKVCPHCAVSRRSDLNDYEG
ncbi:hypothetical protein [Streptomyces sp. NPDC048638]|uniref:hypothetical protein n=1 Tax=Streptomyces sp. NPDC048638 TaxID=3365580 RepID=UPI00370F9A41